MVDCIEKCWACNFDDIRSSDEYWMKVKENLRKELSGCNSCLVWFQWFHVCYKNFVSCIYTQTMLTKSWIPT